MRYAKRPTSGITKEIHLTKDITIIAPVITIHAEDYIRFPNGGKAVKVPRKVEKDKYIKCDYLPVYMGFDIETTNYITEDYKRAYMYIAQISICSDKEGYVYLMRTWPDVIYFFDKMAEYYRTGEERRVICLDANFGFEFQFLRHWLEWDQNEFAFFAKEERKPLLATYRGIEFRECLTITGGSLAQLAKDYTITQKLVGDLDYRVMRNHLSPIEGKDLDYVCNDVIILSEFSYYMFKRWIIPEHRIPLTKTGLLRAEVRKEFDEVIPDNDRAVCKTLIAKAFPPLETYVMWFRYLFRGGYVHSNITKTGYALYRQMMFDITSSYPAQMNFRYYPMGAFKPCEFSEELLQHYCVIFIADFYGVESKYAHSIESTSKCIALEGAKVDNGRVSSCKYMRVMLTELDYANYNDFYEWEHMNVLACWIAERGRLPKYITNVLNRHYKQKAALKKAGLKDTPEYAIEKSGVNAAFGLMCTRINLDKISYTDDWVTQEAALDYEEEKANQILLPQWGIYVACHGRRELLKTVKACEDACGNSYPGGVVCYNDTDSIKTEYDERIFEVIKRYNKNIEIRAKRIGLIEPEFNDLGMFDFEGIADRAKYLGAKRYIIDEEGKIKATVAGMPKSAIKNIKGDIFSEFSIDGMKLEAEDSEKLTTAYNDKPHSDIIAGVRMSERSSVALYEIPFKISLDKGYYNLVFGLLEQRRLVL